MGAAPWPVKKDASPTAQPAFLSGFWRRRLRSGGIILQSSGYLAGHDWCAGNGVLAMCVMLSAGSRWMVCSFLLMALTAPVEADEPAWVALIGAHGLEAWRAPTDGWLIGGDATLDAQNPKL